MAGTLDRFVNVLLSNHTPFMPMFFFLLILALASFNPPPPPLPLQQQQQKHTQTTELVISVAFRWRPLAFW